MAEIEAIVMPKWGLAMQEGMVASWLVEEGEEIEKGEEIADIETSKIANAFESPVEGLLRRLVAGEGETLPVGALLAVVAPEEVGDATIDAFVADFQARFAAEGSSAAVAPEPQTVEAGGRRLRYLELGDAAGTPVLLVHGFGGDLNNWLFNQEELAEDYRTLAIDLPGHGGSAKEVGDGDVGTLAAAVLAFMDARGIERAHLVGHSLGGAICIDLALNHPGRVASLTALAPAGLGPEIDIAFIDGFIASNRARKLRPFLEMLVHDPALVTAEMVEDVLRFKRLDGVEAALNSIAQACFSGGRQSLQFEARLEELRCPAQVIWGKQDRILPASHAEDLPETLEAHLFEDAGHLIHMERAREVNALIGAMLRR
ncbi:acetoin dehydrogenase dihydrolipoyllysine-residue acetyltransferase subunit [Geminicoccaceae bacterium 1502E]|nr:acetoin dehydrogenase dihydrolipoyllysine-residue acetyltransferase subunit [Geminicoccaceae bacterium 1502E]